MSNGKVQEMPGEKNAEEVRGYPTKEGKQGTKGQCEKQINDKECEGTCAEFRSEKKKPVKECGET